MTDMQTPLGCRWGWDGKQWGDWGEPLLGIEVRAERVTITYIRQKTVGSFLCDNT